MIANRPEPSKLYHPRMPSAWWFKKWNYFLFLLRELTSVFIGAFLVVYLIQIYHIGLGEEQYAQFAKQFESPAWIIFHMVALVFAVYHSITWFKTASVILIPRVGSWVIPAWIVTAMHIAAWVIVSLVILILFISM